MDVDISKILQNMLTRFDFSHLAGMNKLRELHLSLNFIDLANVWPDHVPLVSRLCETLYNQFAPTTVLAHRLYIGGVTSTYCGPELVRRRIGTVINASDFTYVDTAKYEYIHLDVADDPSVAIDMHFAQVCEVIDRAIDDSKHAVLIHCAAGVSRSATLVIAYLMYAYAVSFEHALAFLTEKRYCVNPNEGFVRRLRAYDFSRLRPNPGVPLRNPAELRLNWL